MNPSCCSMTALPISASLVSVAPASPAILQDLLPPWLISIMTASRIFSLPRDQTISLSSVTAMVELWPQLLSVLYWLLHRDSLLMLTAMPPSIWSLLEAATLPVMVTEDLATPSRSAFLQASAL